MRVRLEIGGFARQIDIGAICRFDRTEGREKCDPPEVIHIPVVPPLSYFWVGKDDDATIYPLTITFYRTDYDPAFGEWVYAESYYEEQKENKMKITVLGDGSEKRKKKTLYYLHMIYDVPSGNMKIIESVTAENRNCHCVSNPFMVRPPEFCVTVEVEE